MTNTRNPKDGITVAGRRPPSREDSAMPRPLRAYVLIDTRDAILSREMLALIGEAGNGSDQGHWIVTAPTKVSAAARATEVIGHHFRPREFAEVSGGGYSDITAANLLQRDGDLVAWRRPTADQVVVRTVRGGASRQVEVVAHWRRDRNNLDLVPVERDVTLMDVVPVPVSPEMGRELRGDAYGGTEILFATGVATHTARDGEVWVPGIGRCDAARARDLMSGLAGALAELDSRIDRSAE